VEKKVGKGEWIVDGQMCEDRREIGFGPGSHSTEVGVFSLDDWVRGKW